MARANTEQNPSKICSAENDPSSCLVVRPLLRWAGSKRRLLPALLSSAPRDYGTYYEPFAGSACLFLALRPQSAVLGDINPWLMRTYKTVRSRPRLVYEQLAVLSSSREEYYRIRSLNPRRLGAIASAVRFLYLNRHAFNGVYRESRGGHFNVPLGSKVPTLLTWTQFQQFCSALRTAELRREDFENCVKDTKHGDFVYLDPPYAKLGARNRGEYGRDAFRRGDVRRLLSCVKAMDAAGVKVLLSFFDSPTLRRELNNWNIRTLSVARSVSGFSSKRRRAREVLIKNY